MHSDFHNALEAAIGYLADLKKNGTQFVAANSQLLQDLSRPAPQLAPTAAPPSYNLSPPPAPAQFAATPGPAAQAPAKVVPSGQSKNAFPEPVSEAEPPVPSVSPTARPVLSAPLTPEEKLKALAELRERALVCQKCAHLAKSRTQVVFGVGDPFSPLMFVGEAPGADEDRLGEPFVGRAGQLLTKIIETMGLSRSSVYIANILKCRPDTPGQTSGNRKPLPSEMQTCLPYLQAQIDLIQPRVLVALGATAVEGLLGLTGGITKLRGKFQTFRNIPVMPTYHPSYLLHNQVLSVKREVWEDMLQVMELLQLPISEKQRNYFMK